MNSIRKIGLSLAALAALAFGASAIAGAASNSTTTPSGTSSTAQQGRPQQGQPPAGARAHRPETALTGDTAEKVKAAALKKISGGEIIRVETDSDHGSPYEAHVRKSDGTEVEVLVNKDFDVTAVNAMGRR